MERKVLVFDSNNRISELPSGDTFSVPGSAQMVFSAANANAGTINKGQVVYTKSDGGVDLARANASGTTEASGLVADATIANGATGLIQSNGNMTMDTEDWDAITGQTGGLTPGAYYIVDPDTAGKMIPRNTATITAGEFIALVGKALSATEFKIEPAEAQART